MFRSKQPEPTQPATVLTGADLERMRRTGPVVGRPVTMVICAVCGDSNPRGGICTHPNLTSGQRRRVEAAQVRIAQEEAMRRQPAPCVACGLHTPIGRGHACKAVTDKALDKANAGQLVGVVNALKAAGLKVVSSDD